MYLWVLLLMIYVKTEFYLRLYCNYFVEVKQLAFNIFSISLLIVDHPWMTNWILLPHNFYLLTPRSFKWFYDFIIFNLLKVYTDVPPTGVVWQPKGFQILLYLPLEEQIFCVITKKNLPIKLMPFGLIFDYLMQCKHCYVYWTCCSHW